MELLINIKLLEKSCLSLDKFVTLQCLVEERLDIDLESFIPAYQTILRDLERNLYIKIIDGEIFPRQKTLDLFGIKENDVTFEEFWKKYHDITGKPKTDKEPAKKYFRKLTKKQKKQALDMIKAYYESLSDTRYCKKARTYLADKNFQDEYLVEHSREDDPFIQKA